MLLWVSMFRYSFVWSMFRWLCTVWLTEDITVMLTEARDTHEINLALKAAFTDENEGNI